MSEPYYTSTPQCMSCGKDHPTRYGVYAVFDSKHTLHGVYCLECARKKVELLRRNTNEVDS